MTDSLSKLTKWSAEPNIADEFDDDKLDEIARKVYEDFAADKESRSEWEQLIEAGLELAEMKMEEKDFPWRNASNLKYPAITIAGIQFSAYTYPMIIRNDKVVEAEVLSFDYDGSIADLAERVAKYMNYQLLIKDRNWPEQLRHLLQMLTVEGTVLKKVYYDPITKNIVTELLGYKDVYVNNNIKSLDDARRVSHLMVKNKNDLITKMRAGIYRDIDLDELSSERNHSTEYSEDMDEGEFELIEQHCYFDLDDDGFEEPYIVTILSEYRKVLRITARFDANSLGKQDNIKANKKGQIYYIKPTKYFVDFHYIPSFDGTFYSLSIASLMLSFNKGINSVLNQLINAGTLATTQGGFLSKACRIRGGKIYLEPGEWIKLDSASDVDLDKSIKPLDYKEPSQTLYQLLGFLVEGSKELSSITDVMTGRQSATAVAATTVQVMAEKGMKVFSYIQEGTYSSLAKEFQLIFDLDKRYLDEYEYQQVLNYKYQVTKADFTNSQYRIAPVANPNLSSDVQRMARAQQLLQLLQLPPMQNQQSVSAILKIYLEALSAPDIEQILPPAQQQQQPQPPNPQALKVQSDAINNAGKMKLQDQKQQQDFQLKSREQARKELETKAGLAKTFADVNHTFNEDDLSKQQHQLTALQGVAGLQEGEANRQLQYDQMNHDSQKQHLQMASQAHLQHSKNMHDATTKAADMAHQGHQNAQQNQFTNNQQQQQYQANQQSQQGQQSHERQQQQSSQQHDQTSMQIQQQYQAFLKQLEMSNAQQLQNNQNNTTQALSGGNNPVGGSSGQ